MPNTPNLILGQNLMLFAGSGSTWSAATKVPFAFAKSATADFSREMIEVSSKDSGSDSEYLPGKRNFTLSTDGLLNFTSTGSTQSTDEAMKLFKCGCIIYWQMAVACGTAPSWAVCTSKCNYCGCAYLDSISISANNGELGTWSVKLQGTGEWL